MYTMQGLESTPSHIQSNDGPITVSGVRIYKTPRNYKQKWARATGLIQVLGGLLSISSGIAILCLPDALGGAGWPMSSLPMWGGSIYVLSGICGLRSRLETKGLIILYMVISIISSLLAAFQMLVFIILGSTVDCNQESIVPHCEQYQQTQITASYIISALAAALEVIGAVCGSALCCHGVCCNSDTTPYTVLHVDDESRSNDNTTQSQSSNSFAFPGPPSLSTDDTYALIPRPELNLIKQIGHGGYSEVYLAKWNEQDVAAKRLHEECRREAEVLAKLDHPNIVKLLGVVDERFDFFLVLELCEGGSLRSYLNDLKEQQLGPRFFDFAKQAARPIKYLKEKNIVHKDIKSPNYLLTNCSSFTILKLGDFGLAKNVDITISRATETASYPWMAPELLRDNILSPKYDVYAYGVVVWELWTTKVPFDDVVEPAHLAWRICNDNERPHIPDDCPESVADLMRWCWETDWKMRPNMEQVLSKLATAEEAFVESFAR